jgi:hypothetical protein
MARSSLALTLRIHVSMAGFLLLFYFSLTGLTLNHGDWVEQARARKKQTLMRRRHSWITRARPLRRACARTRHPRTSEILSRYPTKSATVHAPDSRARSDARGSTARVEMETRGLSGSLATCTKGTTATACGPGRSTSLPCSSCSPRPQDDLPWRRCASRRTGFLLGAIGVVLTLVILLALVPR